MSKNEKSKKNISTLILFLILVILIIIYFFIPKTRTVTKTLTEEEYKEQIYDKMHKELVLEEEELDTIEDDYEDTNLNEDELYKVQTEV